MDEQENNKQKAKSFLDNIKKRQEIKPFKPVDKNFAVKYEDYTVIQLIDEGCRFAREKDYEKAQKLFEMALKKEPGNIYALYECAHVYYVLEDYPKCLSCLQTLLKIEESKSFVDYGKNELQQRIADAYYYSGYKNYAKEIYETLLEEKYENVWLFISLGFIYYYEDDYDTALTFFIKAYEKEPDNPDINIFSWAVYSKQEKYELALEFILHGEELGYKTDIYMYEEVSRIYYILENYEQSLVYAQKMLDTDSEYGEGYRRMGYALLGLKKDSLAIENFKKAIDADYAESYMYYFIVHSLIDTDFKTSQKYTELMSPKYPDEPDTYFSQGLIYYNTAKYKKALQCFEKVPEASYLYDNAVYYKYLTLYNLKKYSQILEAYPALSYNQEKSLRAVLLYSSIELNREETAKELIDEIIYTQDKSCDILTACCYFYLMHFDKENTFNYALKSYKAAKNEKTEPDELIQFLVDKLNGNKVCVSQLSNELNSREKCNTALIVDDKLWLVFYFITRLILAVFLGGYLGYVLTRIFLFILTTLN